MRAAKTLPIFLFSFLLLSACGGGGGGDAGSAATLGDSPAVADTSDAPTDPPAADDGGDAVGNGGGGNGTDPDDAAVGDAGDTAAPPPAMADPPAPATAPFAGSWEGTFSGDSQGSWQGTIAADGTVSGSGTGSYGPFTFSGTVSESGDVRFETSGTVSDGTVFLGRIDANGRVSGRWTDSFDEGTFTGSLVEPLSTPTLASAAAGAPATMNLADSLDHASFGVWVEDHAPELLLSERSRGVVDRAATALALPTSPAAMPTAGSASYRGDVAAAEYLASGPARILVGDIDMAADFASGEVAAAADLAGPDGPWGRIDFEGVVIDGNGLAGSARSTNGHAGLAAGRFVGPAADGVAGIFSLDGASRVNGTFVVDHK